jgi:hypothetical protein
MASFAGAIRLLILTDGTDIMADGINVRLNVVAVDRLNRLGYLGEKTK